MRRETLSEVYFNRRMAVLLGLGFASGLPSASKLLGDTLKAWGNSLHVDIKTIGLLSLVPIPFSFKFLWAPVVDRYLPPVLTRRRGWLLLFQLVLVVGIAAMGLLGPTREGQPLQPWVVMAVLVAFFAASQDVVADAYRTDVLPAQERGAGAAMFVNGFRIAMLVTGGLAMLLAEHMSWRYVYLILAACMLIGVAATLLAPESDADYRPASFLEAVYLPVRDFLVRQRWWGIAILFFIVLFKLPDAAANAMVQTFLQNEMGFELNQIALVREVMGLLAALVGALAGGAVMARMRLIPALVLLGVLQALSNAGYCLLAFTGPRWEIFAGVVVVENFCAGMVGAGFVAFLMSLCNRRYSATQYALFTSLSFFTGAIVGAVTGYLVEEWGYLRFFAYTIFTGAPGVLFLVLMRSTVAPPKNGG